MKRSTTTRAIVTSADGRCYTVNSVAGLGLVVAAPTVGA